MIVERQTGNEGKEKALTPQSSTCPHQMFGSRVLVKCVAGLDSLTTVLLLHLFLD